MHFPLYFHYIYFLPINDNRDSRGTQNWQCGCSPAIISAGNWQSSSNDFTDAFDNHWIGTFGLCGGGSAFSVTTSMPARASKSHTMSLHNHILSILQALVCHLHFCTPLPPPHILSLSPLPPSYLVLLPPQLTALLDTRVSSLPKPSFGFCSPWQPPRSSLVPFRLISW